MSVIVVLLSEITLLSVLRLVVFLLLGLFVHSISDVAYPSIVLSILPISESFFYIRCIRFFLFFRLPILSTASISIWVRRLSSPTFIIIDSSSSTSVVLSSFPLSSTSLPLVDCLTLALFILFIFIYIMHHGRPVQVRLFFHSFRRISVL